MKVVFLSCLVLSITCMVVVRPNPPTSEFNDKDVPIGSLVQDNDGKEFHKQGNNSCWRREGDEKPFLSKPIFKYCSYQLISNTTESALSGYNYDAKTDGHIDKVFATNPKQTIIFMADKSKFGSEKETARYFLCKTSGCNVPLSVMKFIEYNAKLDSNLPWIIAKNINI